jgi:uncharacterized protein (TIGR03435 family)
LTRLTAGIVLTLFACGASGQPAAAKIEFEVASIKAAPPPDGKGMRVWIRGGPGTSDPTRLVIENFNLFGLVTRAYDVKGFQISGLDGASSERFNITAKVPEGATKEDLLVMLQNLLTERFKLRLHHETKEMPIYELVVGKGGPKFKESSGEPPKDDVTAAPGPPPGRKLDKDGYPMPPPGMAAFTMVNGSARARFNAAYESMQDLATTLANQMDRPVVDATRLKGKYDFILSWAPEGIRMGAGPPTGGEGPAASAPDESGPSLISAIQEQLGLKLDSKKAPVDTLVIDHYEKVPTEN